MSTLLSRIGRGEAKSYRKIFPSYDWDEDVWRVNQIINEPYICGKETLGFIKGIENETIKQGDKAIQNWIDTNMDGCSCYILFVGEKTYTSRWVKYEMEQATQRGMGRLIVFLTGMENQNHKICQGGPDPYQYHGMYAPVGTPGAYTIKQYYWISGNGVNNISSWINDACTRAGK